jgi:hypothetical protein
LINIVLVPEDSIDLKSGIYITGLLKKSDFFRRMQMVGDLPELDGFFTEDIGRKIKVQQKGDLVEEQEIYIFISKEKDKWIPAVFLDIAVAGIGLHVRLPITIELNAIELGNVFVRFVKKTNGTEEILKEAPVLVRWQDHDEFSGQLKLGLHFHGEIKNDAVLLELLKQIKNERE